MKHFRIALYTATVLAALALTADAQSPLSAQIQRALRSYGFPSAGTFQAGNGAVGTPTMAFASDPTTGFYRGAAGQINATCAGTNCLFLTATNITTPAILYIGTGQDTQLARSAAGQITYTSTLFSTLGSPANGTVTFCSDCTVTTAASCPGTQASCVCAGSGTGAFARRVAGAWYCTF